MTDINQTDGSIAVPPKTIPRAILLRIIPGTLLAILTVIGSIGMTIETLEIAYNNLRSGWIEVDPGDPSWNYLVITPMNMLRWQCGCWGFVASGVAAYAWFYGRWRLASISTVIFFALILASKWLESVRDGAPIK